MQGRKKSKTVANIADPDPILIILPISLFLSLNLILIQIVEDVLLGQNEDL